METNMRLLYVLMLMCCQLVQSADRSKSAGDDCPPRCVCEQTHQGHFRAVCFSLPDLYKFSVKQKHHHIDILDLSYSKLISVGTDLDEFTELMSLDLSDNEIKSIKKILPKSSKLEVLDLRKNKLESFSATSVPNTLQWLYLDDNLLKNVPSHLTKLKNLERLSLKGNPLHCSCENVKTLRFINSRNVTIDDVLCSSPPNLKGRIWNVSEVIHKCKRNHDDLHSDEKMLSDQPEDAETFTPVSEFKSMNVHNNDLNDEDKEEFLGLGDGKSTGEPEIFDGSGDFDLRVGPHEESTSFAPLESEGSGDYSGAGVLFDRSIFSSTTEEPDYEGSGDLDDFNATTVPFFDNIGQFPDFPKSDANFSEITILPKPTVFQGITDWNKEQSIGKKTVSNVDAEKKMEDVEKIDHKESDTVIEEIPEEKVSEEYQESKNETKTSTGTYICIGIIVTCLVALIVVALTKSYVRKRRDRRVIRQQRTDVEKAGKEMVDMNKALLGKPAPIIVADSEKKANGKYEPVPTHENGKTPIKETPIKETPVDNLNGAPEYKNPVISVTPLKFDDSGEAHPSTNGYPEPDLVPHDTRDYLPVTPPSDSGRVKIKLTEMPKPKTPTLITRSRSNAGDVIITPAVQQNGANGAT